ncbi:MAG: sigma-70 family RNA polymerase sigma factor [Acidobacteria bacterium]|jgi:RNA polymerase sigma factor (TIGR02999 family)|nr:sigma-70 family RNA polymerase sigma factor [Acidobacteriota bacterium]
MPERPGDITQLLISWAAGDEGSLDRLSPLVYEELRRIARNQMRRERRGHTLQTTGLVHEAFLRLVDPKLVSFRDRLHFFGAAASAMRRVLVDHARARQTSKRGGGAIRLNLDEEVGAADRHAEILEIDQCLTRLAALDARQSRIVELRFFGGLSIEETAEVEGISPMTVKREWAVARAWLFREMKQRAE